MIWLLKNKKDEINHISTNENWQTRISVGNVSKKV